MMDFVFKMMNFVLKLMTFGRLSSSGSSLSRDTMGSPDLSKGDVTIQALQRLYEVRSQSTTHWFSYER